MTVRVPPTLSPPLPSSEIGPRPAPSPPHRCRGHATNTTIFVPTANARTIVKTKAKGKKNKKQKKKKDKRKVLVRTRGVRVGTVFSLLFSFFTFFPTTDAADAVLLLVTTNYAKLSGDLRNTFTSDLIPLSPLPRTLLSSSLQPSFLSSSSNLKNGCLGNKVLCEAYLRQVY